MNSDASGTFTLNFGLAEGSHVLEAEMNNGAGVMTTAQQNVVVDLTAPTMSNVSPIGCDVVLRRADEREPDSHAEARIHRG